DLDEKGNRDRASAATGKRDRGEHERRPEQPRIEPEPSRHDRMRLAGGVEDASRALAGEQLDDRVTHEAHVSWPGPPLTLQGRVERVRERDQREQRAEERQAVAAGVAT